MSAEDYKFWNDSLAGKNPIPVVDQPECGFYRLKRNGGWVPVAVWIKGPMRGQLGFKIGTEVIGENMGIELWSHYCANPVTEAVYRAVAEKDQPWPDADPTVTAMQEAKKNGGESKHSDQINESVNAETSIKPVDPTDEYREQITTAVAGIAAYAKIESDEADVRALSLRNMLNELATNADKARAAEKKPHWDKGVAVDKKWNPLIDEARSAAQSIKRARDQWEDDKREAQRKAAARNAEQQTTHARDTEWAQAAPGAPEPAPAAPMEVKSNLPPPSTSVKPAYGKASGTSTKMVVTTVDYDKFFAALKLRPEWPTVQAYFTELAQKLANRGIIPDGVTTEERANTR